MTDFLLSNLKAPEARDFRKRLKPFFASPDKKDEIAFKKIVKEFFEFVMKDPDFKSSSQPVPLPAVLDAAGGHSFQVLYLRLATYVLTKRLQKQNRHLYKARVGRGLSQVHESKIGGLLNNFEETKKLVNQQKELMHSRMAYFKEKLIEASAEHDIWVEIHKKAQIQLATALSMDPEANNETLKLAFKLQEAQLNQLVCDVSKKCKALNICVNSIQSIVQDYDGDSSLDLDLMKQQLKKAEDFTGPDGKISLVKFFEKQEMVNERISEKLASDVPLKAMIDMHESLAAKSIQMSLFVKEVSDTKDKVLKLRAALDPKEAAMKKELLALPEMVKRSEFIDKSGLFPPRPLTIKFQPVKNDVWKQQFSNFRLEDSLKTAQQATLSPGLSKSFLNNQTVAGDMTLDSSFSFLETSGYNYVPPAYSMNESLPLESMNLPLAATSTVSGSGLTSGHATDASLDLSFNPYVPPLCLLGDEDKKRSVASTTGLLDEPEISLLDLTEDSVQMD